MSYVSYHPNIQLLILPHYHWRPHLDSNFQLIIMIQNDKKMSKVDDIYGHWIYYQNFICHQNLDSCNNQDFFIQLQLLQILEEIGAPLYTFDKVMEWCTRSFQNGYRFPYNFLGRKKWYLNCPIFFVWEKWYPSHHPFNYTMDKPV